MKKPLEILQLEKELKIKLKRDKINERFGQPNVFDLNSDGKVIGIALSENDISETEIFDIFPDLIFLNLTSNKITEIKFQKLFNLEKLYLGGNKIIDVIPLTKFENLKVLTLWNNPIQNISQIANLSNLQQLYVQDTSINDISFISELKNLKIIALRNNLVSDISILGQISHDISVDLENNKVEYVSEEVALKHNWLDNSLNGPLNYFEYLTEEGNIDDNARLAKHTTLTLQLNPLQFPPNSVIELGKENVLNYYQASREFGNESLSEGRIIVVGDGSAGKSSLIEKILYDSFESGKLQTNGVKIDNWKLKHKDKRDLIFHIWDFGGQEIQHAVHKFFFTEGCFYILVLDNRKEEDPEYWLRQIESLGGGASVIVVFNKHDENQSEIVDKKFLKEKYPNIVGFYNTSCKTGYGIQELVKKLKKEVVKLSTVDEKFPNNWFQIKKSIEKCTAGQHYLTYEFYNQICKENSVNTEVIQKLLLKYFTTIGAVTWFGDTYLNFLHVLSPAWITQGVYKIITAKKTAELFGQININDFRELLQPSNENDYTYDEQHYGYILSMMKKFDLCYTPDDKVLLLPSAFGKIPKLEYRDFRGEDIRTYILQFKDYMPVAILHRFMSKKLMDAYDNNFWYSGIVVRDMKGGSLAMVHADKETKRIYIRIKGSSKLGLWEHIRREFDSIATSYSYVNYSELVVLEDNLDFTVEYEDLINHIIAGKSLYFHSKLQRDYNVGYLIGMFENKEETIEKFKNGFVGENYETQKNVNLVVNILNNNSASVIAEVSTKINIDIDVTLINELTTNIKGEIEYLLENANEEKIVHALQKLREFANDAENAQSTREIRGKGWGRRLKGFIDTLSMAGEKIGNIHDGSEALKNIFKGLHNLASQFNLSEVGNILENLLK